MRTITFSVLALALVAGCGNGSKSNATVQTAPSISASASASPSATPTPKALTAKAVVQGIAPANHAHLTVVYNERTDENHLLGRPNGYLSKAAFADSRIPSSETVGFSKGDVEFGGSVEVFSTQDGAQSRADYIQSILKKDPMLGSEYDYIAGAVLLRVTGKLTPSQAKGYARSLAALTGQSVVGPVTA